MPGWGSDDEGDTTATAATPVTITNNNDSWGDAADESQQDREQPPHQDIQAQPMSLDSLSLIQPKQDGLERFLSKAIIRAFLLPLMSSCPVSYQMDNRRFGLRDHHTGIAVVGRDIAGDYYFLHRDGRKMFDKPWAKTWTPISEEPINKLKRDQSAVYLATDGPTHYYYELRESLTSKSIISLSGNLYVPTSQGMLDYTRIQIELDDNLEIAKQCTICLKWETEWEMRSDGSKTRLGIKKDMVRFLPCRGCKKQVYCSIACHRTGWESHNHKLNCLSTLFGDWSSVSTYWAIDDASAVGSPAAAAAASPAYEPRAETPGKEQTMDWEPAGADTATSTAPTANGAWGNDTPAPTSGQLQDGQNDAWDSPPPPQPSSALAHSAVSASVTDSTMPTSSASVAAISTASASAGTAWASPIPASGADIRNSASWGGDTPIASKAGASSNDAWGPNTPLPASGLSNGTAAGSAGPGDAPTSANDGASAPTAKSAWGSGSSPPHVSAPSSSTQGWGDASTTEASSSAGWGSSDAAHSFRGGRGGFRGGEGRGRGGFRGGDFRGGAGGRGRGGDFVPRGTTDGGWGGFRGRGRGRGRGNEGGQSFNCGHRGGWGGQNSYNSNNNASSAGPSNNDIWGAPTSSTTQDSTADGWGTSSTAPVLSENTITAPSADTWVSKVDEGVGLNGGNKDFVWGEEVTATDSNAKTGADAWD